MPSLLKVHFGYEQMGWSLSLYNSTADLAALEIRTLRLMPMLMRLMGTGVKTDHLLLSDVAKWRDRRVMSIGYITTSVPDTQVKGKYGRQGVKGQLIDPPDPWWTGVQVRLRGTSDKEKGRIFLRGIPDELIQYPLGLVDRGGWKNAYNLFRIHLKDPVEGWQIRITLGDDINPAIALSEVEQVSVSPWAKVHFTTRVAHGLVTGTRVRIGRVAEVPTLNGLHNVTEIIDADTFAVVIQDPDLTLNVPVTIKDGTMRKIVLAYKQIEDVSLGRIITHLPARRFGQLRGSNPVRES